jgi:hypothetical protein
MRAQGGVPSALCFKRCGTLIFRPGEPQRFWPMLASAAVRVDQTLLPLLLQRELFDSEVRRSYPYKGRTPEIVRGGGGTSFEPALRWLREQRGQRFDACIYLTDGEGSPPETKPPCPLLWVIVDGTGGDHLPFGRQILLDGC